MKKGNSRKDSFLSNLNTSSIYSEKDRISTKSKFNFAYFDNSQPAGKDFSQLSHDDLAKLLVKLKEYSKETLIHWQKMPIGRKSGHVLEIYGSFPVKTKTQFIEPKHVPHQAQWGRFRLDNDARLVGFVLPAELHRQLQVSANEFFDCNTFYVVFYDDDHKFYLPSRH